MKAIFIMILTFIAFNFVVYGQDTLTQKQLSITKEFIEAYNNQFFEELFNIFLRKRENSDEFSDEEKKIIKQNIINQYSELYKEYGKASINKSSYGGKNAIILKLQFKKDMSEIMSLIFYFDENNIMQGFGFRNPDYDFPKLEKRNKNKSSKKQKIADIEKLLEKVIKKDKFNGAVLAIDKGNTIYKKCFGLADFYNNRLLNDSSVFELASCSKQFTAMAIMILAEQGKLKYSDSIQRFIPDLPYNGITIENLLTHSSGLPDYMELFDKNWDKNKFANNYDVIEMFKTHKPKVYFNPNEKFDYSNTGYTFLSIIIEKVSGLTYSEFLNKNIFKPLGMNNSRVYNTRRIKNENIENYAFGYVYSDSLKKYLLPDSTLEFNYVRYLDAITGDGTVNSTINDLEIWDKALQNNSLVSQATLTKAFSSYSLLNGKESKYGYGWFLQNKQNSEFVVYHSGGWPGYKTFILRFPNFGTSIVILSNNDYQNVLWLGNKLAMILLKYL